MSGGEPAVFGWVQVAGVLLFTCLVSYRAVNVRVRGRANPFTLRAKKRDWLGVAEIGLFLHVNVWLVATVTYALDLGGPGARRFYGPRLLRGPGYRMPGVALVGAGFVMLVLGLRALGGSWRLGLDEQDPGKLITSGIYGLTRNPIYLFFDLWFLGTFLINGTALFLASALVGMANLHYQITEEEKALSLVHGGLYDAYRARTARYIGPRSARRLLGLMCPGRASRTGCDDLGRSREATGTSP